MKHKACLCLAQGHGGRTAAANATKRVAASLAGSPSSEGLPDSNTLPSTYAATGMLLEPGQGLILDLCLAEALVGRDRDTEEQQKEEQGEGAKSGSGSGGGSSKGSIESQGGGSGGGKDRSEVDSIRGSGSVGADGGDGGGGSCDVDREASSSGGGAGVGSSNSSQGQRNTLAELWQQLEVEEEDVQGPVLRAWTQRVSRMISNVSHRGRVRCGASTVVGQLWMGSWLRGLVAVQQNILCQFPCRSSGALLSWSMRAWQCWRPGGASQRCASPPSPTFFWTSIRPR